MIMAANFAQGGFFDGAGYQIPTPVGSGRRWLLVPHDAPLVRPLWLLVPLAADDQFIVVHHQPSDTRGFITAFEYVNKDLWGLHSSGMILVANGQIAYDSFGGTTPWHGSFEELGPNDLVFRFNCRGGKPLHETRVRRNSDGVWRGIDYRRRRVEVKQLPDYKYIGITNEDGDLVSDALVS